MGEDDALHAESVVFDSYGFAPRAAVDGDAIRRAVEAGASAIELKAFDWSMEPWVSSRTAYARSRLR